MGFLLLQPKCFQSNTIHKTPLAKLQLSSLTSSLKVFGLEVCVPSEEEADIQNLSLFYFFSNFPFIWRRLSMKRRRVPHILYSQTVLSQEKKELLQGSSSKQQQRALILQPRRRNLKIIPAVVRSRSKKTLTGSSARDHRPFWNRSC